jgi:hypothetical protein
MGEDLLDHYRILDAGDYAHCPAPGRAGLNIDPEDPFSGVP